MPIVTLENGARIKTFRAPEDHAFDPLSASATDLARHGFPARPQDPEALMRFNRHFSRMKGRFRYIEPQFSHRPSARLTANGDFAGNQYWSGDVVYAVTGQSFKWVQAEWNVSSASAPTAG
jgi:hypothetical protein